MIAFVLCDFIYCFSFFSDNKKYIFRFIQIVNVFFLLVDCIIWNLFFAFNKKVLKCVIKLDY